MALERIPNHFHEGLLKLVPPFWGKPRIAAFLQSFLDRVTDLEDAAWDVLEARTIDNADKTRLEVLGRVVGQPRLGFADDETYRAVIRGKIRTSRSRALSDDIIEVVRLITQTTLPVRIEHFAPATVWTILTEPAPTTNELDALEYLLPKARGAGIRQHFLWTPETTGAVWGVSNWSSSTPPPPISFVGASAIATGTGAISVAWPAGHANQDLGILAIVSGAVTPPATPAGWTLEAFASVGTTTGASCGLWVYSRVAQSGAEAAATAPTISDRWGAAIVVYRGVRIVEAKASLASPNSNQTSASVPAVTSLGAGRRALTIWGTGAVSGLVSGYSDGSLNEFLEGGVGAGPGRSLTFADRTIGAGVYGPVTATLGASTRSAGVTLALAPWVADGSYWSSHVL
jgi:hypothetical protein